MNQLNKTITVQYEWTDRLDKTKQWLGILPDYYACDFEVSSKYSNEQKEELKAKLEQTTDLFEQKTINNKINSTGLSHPLYCHITHFSFAYSISKAKVIVFKDKEVLKEVLLFLVNSPLTQIWHNASFDFKHIYFHTSSFPKNYEDTQLLTKCLKNNTNNSKALVGLKELMGNQYGSWGISADYFTKKEMYNEDVIKYAATDACATYNLWQKYGRTN